MSVLYNFAQSQEDERTEAAALRLCSTDRVISIASAGDMPLSLAALGARQVTAVDTDPGQLALTGLKLASVLRLAREDAIGFLGYLPMEAARRQSLYTIVRQSLSPDHQHFWDQAQKAVASGVIWVGRFERYMGLLRRMVVPLLGRRPIEALFECTSVEAQEALFDGSINRAYLKSIFRFAFNPHVFSGRGMDPRSLAHRTSEIPLGEQYFGCFRSFCTATLARENYFLQLAMLGRSIDSYAVPAYLTEAGYPVLHHQRAPITLHQGDIVQFLEDAAPASFDKVHLSNICDWMDQESFEKVMTLMVTKCAPGGRAVWRFLHVDRTLPPELAAHISEDRELGKHLRLCDRYPFYTIVPARIAS